MLYSFQNMGLSLIISLQSEDPKFEFRSTHLRTNQNHNNAFPWSVRKHTQKVCTCEGFCTAQGFEPADNPWSEF